MMQTVPCSSPLETKVHWSFGKSWKAHRSRGGRRGCRHVRPSPLRSKGASCAGLSSLSCRRNRPSKDPDRTNGRPLVAFDPFNSKPSGHGSRSHWRRLRSATGRYFTGIYSPASSESHAAEWERYAGPRWIREESGILCLSGRKADYLWDLVWAGSADRIDEAGCVKIDMPNGFDFAWKIDVKKASGTRLHIAPREIRRNR